EGRWYLHSTKARTFIPARTNPSEGFSLNDYELAGVQGKMFSASSDTLTMSAPESKTGVVVRVLLFGPKYISLYFDGEKGVPTILEGK
ncbi:MAG: hypothetical protein ABL927_05245, partial [Bdellovibrionales bacterium]